MSNDASAYLFYGFELTQDDIPDDFSELDELVKSHSLEVVFTGDCSNPLRVYVATDMLHAWDIKPENAQYHINLFASIAYRGDANKRLAAFAEEAGISFRSDMAKVKLGATYA